MRTAKIPTAKTIVAPSHGYSCGNHPDSKGDVYGSSTNISANTKNNNSNSVSFIGESLLQFFPSSSADSINGRKSDELDDGSKCKAPGFDNRMASHTSEIELRRHRLSLLLDGGISNDATKDRYTDDQGNRTQERNTHRNRVSRKRILLRGPPRSGKTSLAMELAYAKASVINSYSSEISSAAIIYRLNKRPCSDNNISKNCFENDHQHSSLKDPFPLICRPLKIETHEKCQDNTEGNPLGRPNPKFISSIDVVPTKSATNRDDEYAWDPTILNRINIRYVSSIRQLWEDLLMLAGKPIHEQPTGVIIVEDLDHLIASEGKLLDLNRRNNIIGKNKNKKNPIDLMLKTMAIATDTALALDECQRKFESRSDSVTLLVTLTADPRQRETDASKKTLNPSQRNGVANTMASDVLVLISSIDTVVTLHQNQKGQNSQTNENNKGEFMCSSWMNSKRTRNSSVEISTIDGRNGDNESNNSNNNFIKSRISNESTVVNSTWQAEIQDREDGHYCGKSYHTLKSNTNSESLVDYAFVESFLKEGCNQSLENNWKRNEEIRWKDCGANK